MKLTIDDHVIEVPRGTTILQAAREHDIPIPTLCYHEMLEPYAACRLCLVELASARGKLAAACAYQCEEGLVVLTNSPKVRQARRNTAELLLATGAHLPAVRALADALGADATRTELTQCAGTAHPGQDGGLAPSDCILCGLCVRACNELVGARAISLVGRGLNKKVATPFGIAAADCIGCATCVLICPTGAITLDDVMPAPPPSSSDHPGLPHDPRTCRLCSLEGPATTFFKVDDQPALGVHTL